MELIVAREHGFQVVQADPMTHASIGDPSADTRSLYDAAATPTSLGSWLAIVAARVQPLVERGQGMIAALIEVEAGRAEMSRLLFVGNADTGQLLAQTARSFPSAAELTTHVVALERELFAGGNVTLISRSPALQRAAQAPYAEHLLLRASAGRFRIFFLVPSNTSALPDAKRGALEALASHVGSALALRLATGSGGRDSASEPVAFEHLRRFRRCERTTPELARSLWQGLLEGQWSLLGHWCDRERRTLLIRRNQPGLALSRPLTPREQRAAELAVRGHSLKSIGFDMKVAVSTASLLVASAIKKLGLRSRVELTELFGLSRELRVSAHTFQIEADSYALLDIPLRKLAPPSCLTGAEREVVLGVLSDKSNAEIAQTRRTSVNTVANQLRGVYLKLGISGRAELISNC
jgi:DNA-binding CsgD family transcriptional regulator